MRQWVSVWFHGSSLPSAGSLSLWPEAAASCGFHSYKGQPHRAVTKWSPPALGASHCMGHLLFGILHTWISAKPVSLQGSGEWGERAG